MGEERPEADEISRKFIIDKKYGTTDDKPYPPETLVLCKVSFASNEIESSDSSDSEDVAGKFSNLRLQGWIFRNDSNHHAEELCLQRLRQKGRQARRIEAELIQSYAPCHDCADKIIAYKKEMAKAGKEVSIKITFANYYRWIGQHTNKDGVENLRKLKEMTNSNIDLHLLQGKTSWENLFKDDELVNLNREDQRRLLKKATSKARRKREGYDEALFDLILDERPERQWKALPLEWEIREDVNSEE